MSDKPRSDSSPSQLRHELRTPLNQIIGYTQMLLEQAEEDGHREYTSDLQKIEKAGQRLVTLVDVLVNSLTAHTTATSPTIELPLASTPGVSLAGSPGGDRLLVVDDNEMNRDMLARRLQQKGYAVTTASGGAEALQKIESERFDLVLLDVMMPEISGLDVLRIVRAARSVTDLPIIMATARDQSQDVVAALGLGANDYVTKPLDFNVVMARVETQLSLKRTTDEVRRLNAQLVEAQERIAWLVESSTNAMADIDAWSGAVAAELTNAIGARRITIWNGVADITSDTKTWPDMPSEETLRAAIKSRRFIERGDSTLVPVAGLSGDVYGALIVEGKPGRWTEAETRLVASFARQLGGAVELEQTRLELKDAEERTRARRKQLEEQGFELVQMCPECGLCYGSGVDRCTADGQQLVSPRFIPYIIGDRYRLVSRIGQGGMGIVMQAHDQRLDRQVAIKIISAEHFDDPRVRLRFEQEARAAARIDHSGVVTIFDSGELPDGSGFIIMERLFGCDLGQLLRSYGPGTPRQVASLLRQAAAALGAAHHAGLVHRDIKPENIFLEERAGGFSVKLLDFGIAKPIDLDTHLTHGGTILGTPAYMAPEQLSGKSLDARSDIYSFAAVAYEALAGRGVTLEKTLGKVIVDVMQCEPPMISVLLHGTPKAVDDAFCYALAKDREQRPASAEGWVAGFVDVLESMPAQVTGWPERLSAVSGTSLIAPTEIATI